ncbi:MAG: transporter substrate-binding domain-containing protein [Parasporobacterium sp.]|nr:transporter substrate-binding domain-containing protein [Parasporobacterium sp.]
MKKIIALVLAAVCVLSMTAFAAEEKAPVPTVQEGILNMATNAEFPPYEFKEGDDFAGIDVEIAQAIAEALGLELKINDVEFGSIIGGVQTGKFDIGLAGMTVTEERLQSINFTDSYATGIQVIIVKEGSDIKTVDDIADKMIGVQQDTTGDIYCSGDYGDDHVTAYKTGADAVQALVSGKVDCVVIDNEPAKSYVAATKGLVILDTEYVTEDYAACISKDNEELLAAVNAVLADLKESGRLQEIVDKYISADEASADAE